MILVPAYVYILNMDEVKARATSVFSILPMVFVSGIMYYKSNYIDWKLGLFCAVGGVVGGIVGAKLLKKISIKNLKILFTLFLIYASVKMIFF